MKFSWKLASVIAVLGLGIIGSLAVAAPRRSWWSGSDDRPRVERVGPRHHLAGLAKELGVAPEKLRDALAKVRDELGPPKLPRPQELPAPPRRPRLEQIEQRCTKVTDALASELGKGGDEVRTAIKAVIKARIEKAADAGRLTRARADRMIARIDSAKCVVPPFGPHVALACGPGPGHAGDRLGAAPFPGIDERPADPPVPLGPPAM